MSENRNPFGLSDKDTQLFINADLRTRQEGMTIIEKQYNEKIANTQTKQKTSAIKRAKKVS